MLQQQARKPQRGRGACRRFGRSRAGVQVGHSATTNVGISNARGGNQRRVTRLAVLRVVVHHATLREPRLRRTEARGAANSGLYTGAYRGVGWNPAGKQPGRVRQRTTHDMACIRTSISSSEWTLALKRVFTVSCEGGIGTIFPVEQRVVPLSDQNTPR